MFWAVIVITLLAWALVIGIGYLTYQVGIWLPLVIAFLIYYRIRQKQRDTITINVRYDDL